jgi:hypothetical protein
MDDTTGDDPDHGSCMATVLLIHRDSKRVKISLSTTSVEGLIMRSDLVFDAFTCIVLMFLVFFCGRLRRSGQSRMVE